MSNSSCHILSHKAETVPDDVCGVTIVGFTPEYFGKWEFMVHTLGDIETKERVHSILILLLNGLLH